MSRPRRHRASAAPRARLWLLLGLGVSAALAACKGGSEGASATSLDPPVEPEPVGEAPAFPFVDHVDQHAITAGRIGFDELFVLGDELFEAAFTTLDGAGVAVLPDGSPLPGRFSRTPPGGGRVTGPNAQACAACHNTPFPTSAGEAASNVAQDPAGDGVGPFNHRNTPSLFGSAVVQRLAEEMTESLWATRDAVVDAARPGGPPVTADLLAKGVEFGSITARRDLSGRVSLDTTGVRGVDPDLVVRPFGWKGQTTTLRDFVRGAADGELGMEPEELVAKDALGRLDPDGDGVERELSVGDVTALTIYVAAQEVPSTLAFAVREGLAPTPSRAQAAAIRRGEELFRSIGCAECHVPLLRLDDPVFEEPTLRGRGQYLDVEIEVASTGLDPARPFRFDLVREGDFPRLEPDAGAGAVARVYGDLRRHRMGAALADAQATLVRDASGRPALHDGVVLEVPSDTFLTAELWGTGNTGPWLHDGRAGSLEEAILLHGADAPPPPGDLRRSEAQEARDAFAALARADRDAVVEFLESLIHVAIEPGDA